MNTFRVYVDGMANGRGICYALRFSNEPQAQAVAEALRQPARRQRVSVWLDRELTRSERIAEGIKWAKRGRYGYASRIIINALTIRGVDRMLDYVDAETLEVARLVAEAEGITLAEAIRDQVELFAN